MDKYELELYGHYEHQRDDDYGRFLNDNGDFVFHESTTSHNIIDCDENGINTIVEFLNLILEKYPKNYENLSEYIEFEEDYGVDIGYFIEDYGTVRPILTGYTLYQNGKIIHSNVTHEYTIYEDFYELDSRGYSLTELDCIVTEEDKKSVILEMADIAEDRFGGDVEKKIADSVHLDIESFKNFYINFLSEAEDSFNYMDWSDSVDWDD